MNSKKKKIIVGLSGGVDSAVTALLLKEAGHEITGVFMQNWMNDFNDPYCTSEQDLSDAKAVCQFLDIPFRVVNFAENYWNRVFQHCLDEFAKGRTPNPDIGCNREIKFKVFLDYALAEGADYLATGHYASVVEKDNQYCLMKARDLNKDQTYFLYTLHQDALKHVFFPLAHYLKPEVRALAKAKGLPNYNKKDSTGICFIGERRFKDFLSEYLLAQPGPIETLAGEVLGQHSGLMFYTLGQRKGLGLGGRAQGLEEPWYVIGKDVTRRALIVGQGEHHPHLYAQSLRLN
jgi:tRNA-specific 2-thiouridylase